VIPPKFPLENRAGSHIGLTRPKRVFLQGTGRSENGLLRELRRWFFA